MNPRSQLIELDDMNKDKMIAKMKSDVQTYGWHCLSVHPREGEDGTPFTYTIGLTDTFHHPEIMIFGLSDKVSHGILTDCVEMIRSGAAFQPNVEYADVVAGDYKVIFKQISQECLPEYFGAAVGYYEGKSFSGLVMFWPDKNHLFPWQEEASTAQREALNVVQQ